MQNYLVKFRRKSTDSTIQIILHEDSCNFVFADYFAPGWVCAGL